MEFAVQVAVISIHNTWGHQDQPNKNGWKQIKWSTLGEVWCCNSALPKAYVLGMRVSASHRCADDLEAQAGIKTPGRVDDNRHAPPKKNEKGREL
jgi:hypothetical protein